jgi:putative DNA primase/helicase
MNSLIKIIDIGNKHDQELKNTIEYAQKEFLFVYSLPDNGVDVAGATEVIVDYIHRNYKIYTVRDDNINEMWIYQEGIYTQNGKSVVKEIVREITLKKYKKHFSDIIISKIEADTGINKEEFFKEEDIKYCCLKNGIFNLKTGILLPFDPKLRFFNKINAEYKPTAHCPKIVSFFKSVLSTKKDLLLMQEIIGSCLYREYKWEKSFMLLGAGRNGKGKAISLIKNFLGPENISSLGLTTIANGGSMVSDLFGKLANIAGDLSKTSLKETGLFKELTGRDMITCDRKYKTPLHFVNYAKMVFCANELPFVYDNSLGFYDRWEIINFNYTFVPAPEYNNASDKTNLKIRDPNIIESISNEAELNGLFNWAYKGLTRLLDNGSFSSCQTSDETKKTWMRNSSSFNAFALDCLEFCLDKNIEKDELRTKYVIYCRLFKLETGSDAIIKNIMERSGASDSRKRFGSERKYIWTGVYFKGWDKILKNNPSLLKIAEQIELTIEKEQYSEGVLV